MATFLQGTDLDTMSVPGVALGTHVSAAARDGGAVKQEQPAVELHPLSGDGMDGVGALEVLPAELVAAEAPSEASGESDTLPDMDADVDAPTLWSESEAAAGGERAVAPDEVQEEDLDESVLPSEPEDDAEGARAMGADNEWTEPHADSRSHHCCL